MRLVEQTPDLGHCWVRYVPKPWPGSGDLWLDLSSRELGGTTGDASALADVGGAASRRDVVYLPPVDVSQESARVDLAKTLLSAGTPVLTQSLPGSQPASPGCFELWDVLQTVATGDLSSLEKLPADSMVLWPLIGGYTDDPEVWLQGLTQLARVGVRCVQGLAVELPPADRRRVIEVAGDRGFERLFHGPLPSEREFAVAVRRSGMEPWMARPLPTGPAGQVRNRRLAETLALIGELWLRLGRAEARGQAFYRAARWVDRESHDLVVLAREGNLGVVTWLDEDSRAVVEEFATEEESTLLRELRRQYLELPTETE